MSELQKRQQRQCAKVGFITSLSLTLFFATATVAMATTMALCDLQETSMMQAKSDAEQEKTDASADITLVTQDHLDLEERYAGCTGLSGLDEITIENALDDALTDIGTAEHLYSREDPLGGVQYYDLGVIDQAAGKLDYDNMLWGACLTEYVSATSNYNNAKTDFELSIVLSAAAVDHLDNAEMAMDMPSQGNCP